LPEKIPKHWLRIVAVVVAERVFVQVGLQVLRAHRMIYAIDAAL